MDIYRSDRSNASNEDYDAHVEKISLLRSSGELDQLVSTREQFARIFPLTAKLWLEWIEDEQMSGISNQNSN